ncbi:hypothetical protein [Sulfurospirillum arcachonense]|uniref:hypothetical protein n=1 Tax=Sulfurospirillum arcachonense TaxID=57666 RepID=UPI00046A7E2A|nr:hypothetical protein [Sulfurospirillum arcachonense]
MKELKPDIKNSINKHETFETYENFEKRHILIKEAPCDINPICPYCKEELFEIWLKTKGIGYIEQKQILLCPYCRAFLGYGSVQLF